MSKKAKDEIKIGDLIVTSGENNTYPKNIPIGFVVKTTGLDYETSLTLEIEPIIDFTRLENVFVLNISQIDGEAD
jgi:rod shape-determining protein MreC